MAAAADGWLGPGQTWPGGGRRCRWRVRLAWRSIGWATSTQPKGNRHGHSTRSSSHCSHFSPSPCRPAPARRRHPGPSSSPASPAHRTKKSKAKRRNRRTRKPKRKRRRRRPLRRQGRAPQPADRRPDRHRTGLLADGRTIAFVRGGDIFSVRADGSGQRQLTSGPELDSPPVVSPERPATSSSSAAPRPGPPADLYTVSARRRRPARADQRRRRRPRSRLLARRPGDRLRPQHRRDRRRHTDDIYSVRPQRRRPGAADPDRPASTSSRRATSPAASSSAAARAAKARPPTPTSTRCARNGTKVKPQVAGVGSAYVEDVAADGHTLLFRRDQGLWVKRIGPAKARKLSQLPDGSETNARLLLRRPQGRRLRRRRRSASRWSRSTSPTAASASSPKAST